MILAFLTLIAGLAISAVAIYYSVVGLAAIFAGAVVPIMIMGVILEISKLVAAWWLKWNWKRAPTFLKSYMLLAVAVLMIITSLGIFGFLSKAHVEQGVPAGDVIAQVEMIDQQIALEQTIIKQSREATASLDAQIDKYTALGAVTKGVVARKEQAPERKILTTQIKESQVLISKLRHDKIPLSSKLRSVEAEVGPVKYIAQLIYGDDPSSTLLEKAVVWVIMVIVFVFDPLAILLLLAAQLSFQWAKQQRLEKLEEENEDIEKSVTPSVTEEQDEKQDGMADASEPRETILAGHDINIDDVIEQLQEERNQDRTEKELLTKATEESILTTNNEQDEVTGYPIPEEYQVLLETIPQDVMDELWQEFDEIVAADAEPKHHTPETHPY